MGMPSGVILFWNFIFYFILYRTEVGCFVVQLFIYLIHTQLKSFPNSNLNGELDTNIPSLHFPYMELQGHGHGRIRYILIVIDLWSRSIRSVRGVI